MDPASEASAARIKLAWWQEEMRRLTAGAPIHPISAYLKSLPRAAQADFAPLQRSIDAAAAEVAGAPLERGADLAPHAHALRAFPLEVASRLAGGDFDEPGLRALYPSACRSATFIEAGGRLSACGARRARAVRRG